jgi:hypothetical protein
MDVHKGVSISTASSMDVHFFLCSVSLSTANRMDVQGVTISTARSMDLQTCMCRVYVFPQPAVWTCRMCAFLSPAVWACRVYPFFKCRNVGMYGIQSVRYQNEQNCRCRNQSSTGIRGPSCYRNEIQDARMPMHRP